MNYTYLYEIKNSVDKIVVQIQTVEINFDNLFNNVMPDLMERPFGMPLQNVG